ncbi:AI-2E family transporter [Alkalibacterium kapii]|uniref:AI-2E family transporter n=1 Tax=Alkalibacterium kapii TaxID=426704 RepID=A0A511AWF2_9LACT|nr:AI-2E family transporter [Alkalibacterium kapii]GEK91982.1 AI-2E family transporter [Alkalibacterium kapii]
MVHSKLTRRLINVVLILLAVFLLSLLSDTFYPVFSVAVYLLIPIIFGTYLYYAFRPIKQWLFKKTGKDGLAAFLSLTLFLVIFGFLLFFVFKVVYEQAIQLATSLNFSEISQSNATLYQLIDRYLPAEDLFNDAVNWFQRKVVSFSRRLPDLFSSVGSIGSQVLLTFLSFFYLMKDDSLIKKAWQEHLAKQYKKERKAQDKVAVKIDQTLATYISGQMIVAIILGILMYFGYLLIGIPYAFLLAVIALVTNLIPFIGPIIGTVPAVIVALTISLPLVLKTLLIAVVMQQIESNLVTPYIMGTKLPIHPFTVIIVVLVSINLFGIVGALIATPTYLSLKLIVTYLIERRYVSMLKEMD